MPLPSIAPTAQAALATPAEHKARRKEFFGWFGNRPEGYRLYTAEPRREPSRSAGPAQAEEDW